MRADTLEDESSYGKMKVAHTAHFAISGLLSFNFRYKSSKTNVSSSLSLKVVFGNSKSQGKYCIGTKCSLDLLTS